MARERTVGEVVNRTARLLRQFADQRLAPFGLSAGTLPVLGALTRGEPMSQKALTEFAGIEQPTMAATLGRMERDGIIERRPDPADRRSALFTLTTGTQNRAAEIAAAIQAMNDDVLAHVADEDRAALLRALDAVSAYIVTALGGRA